MELTLSAAGRLRLTTIMLRALVALAGAAAASAQHHGYGPDFGDCTCATFCDGSCKSTVRGKAEGTGPANVTLYRMSPFGVIDMTNKNTGDVPGDTSFVVSRRTTAYECRMNPSSFQCSGGGMAQFEGDDPNSTDLVLQWQIEVDGNWGPYQYCNPVNNTDQLGAWACVNELHYSGGGGHSRPPPPKNFPLQCSSQYTGADQYCWSGKPSSSTPLPKLADCCAHAERTFSHSWTYVNGSCNLFRYAWQGDKCTGGVSGSRIYKPRPPPPGPPPPPPCDCLRMNQTVGLRNMSGMGGHGRRLQHGHGGYMSEFGIWYSHPGQGQCNDGHRVGDGSGCTWRAIGIDKAINATCLYKHIDDNVEKASPACFSQCPPAPAGADPKMTNCASFSLRDIPRSVSVFLP